MKGDNSMKRICCALLIISLLLAALAACGQNPKVLGTSKKNQDEKTSLLLEEPPMYDTYHFESYDEMIRAMTNQNAAEYEKLLPNEDRCGEVYKKMMAVFAEGSRKIVVPQIDGKTIELRKKDGLSRITWMTNELYNLPWMWYHCIVNDRNLIVSFTDVSVLDNERIENAKTYLEVLSILAPGAPAPDNYQEYEGYSNIYEEEVYLADGNAVKALICEGVDARDYVMIYQDERLIILDAEREVLTEELLRSFSMVPYTAE